jgi:hypothetical protein
LRPEDEDKRFLPNDAKFQIARQNKTVTIELIALRISDAKTKNSVWQQQQQQQPQFITKIANVKQGNGSSIPNISTGRALPSAGKSNAVEHSDPTGGLHRYRYRTVPRVKEGNSLHVHGEENLKFHKQSSMCDNVKHNVKHNVKPRCTEKRHLDLTEKMEYKGNNIMKRSKVNDPFVAPYY